LFFTDDLFHGTWQTHPMNAELRFADAPYSFGRCAGRLFRNASGELVRPIHASRRYYGERVELRRIDELSPTRFQESPLSEGPLAELCSRAALHHLCVEGERVACDLRDRVSYSQGVPLLGRWADSPPPAPVDFQREAK
jgi:hypothetical protein